MADSTPDSTNISLSEREAAKFGPHVLPPCRVCGAQATGFHYGANTCEACKGFFHRSLSKKDQHVCVKTSKCELKPGNRSMCPACRYKRCLEIGMSKEGIKTGRYSYAKRTQDILELKAIGKFHTRPTRAKPVVVEKESPAQPILPTPIVSPVKIEPPTGEKLQTIMGTISRLIEARHKLVAENHKQVKKQCQSLLMMQNLGEMGPRLLGALNKEHLEQGSPQGGTNIHFPSYRFPMNFNDLLGDDGQHGESLRQWVHMLGGQGGVLKNMVDYIKAIPEFKELPMNDQIILVKHCVAEVWLIGRYAMFNAKEKQFTSAAGITLDLNTVVGTELADIMCSSAVKLQKLQMDMEINTLLSAFVVVSPDREVLEARDKVEAIQEKILEAMLFVLNTKYGELHMLRFAHLAEVVTELRNVTELYLKLTNTLITKISDMPPLLTEILSLS